VDQRQLDLDPSALFVERQLHQGQPLAPHLVR
jgi:hypothetical protein